jgi:STAS domain
MHIVVSHEERGVPVSLVFIRGDLTSEEPLKTKAREEHDAGAKNILLDLSDVPYISSSGLRAIHYIFDLFRVKSDDGGQLKHGIADGTYKSHHLKLLNPSKNSMKALQVAGYDMFLEIYTDLDEALTSY